MPAMRTKHIALHGPDLQHAEGFYQRRHALRPRSLVDAFELGHPVVPHRVDVGPVRPQDAVPALLWGVQVVRSLARRELAGTRTTEDDLEAAVGSGE
jgi:hypothetical protein